MADSSAAATSTRLIRRATPRDAAALAELGRDAFCAAFAHLYPPEDLASFLADSYSLESFAAALADPAQALWIAEAGGHPLAYAHAGPCSLPHPEVTPACGELKRLYVLPGRQNTGVGGELMRIALDWLARPGRMLWIGVWSKNLGAQRLYGRHGFRKVGGYQFAVGNTRDDEFILRRG